MSEFEKLVYDLEQTAEEYQCSVSMLASEESKNKSVNKFHNARAALLSAIATLQTERDEAVGKLNDYDKNLRSLMNDIEVLRKERDEAVDYANKLVEQIPFLPKDVEVLREANAKFAQENHELKAENSRLKELAFWRDDGLPLEGVTVEIDFDPFFGGHEYGHGFVENSNWYIVHDGQRFPLQKRVYRWRLVPEVLFSEYSVQEASDLHFSGWHFVTDDPESQPDKTDDYLVLKKSEETYSVYFGWASDEEVVAWKEWSVE